MGFSVKALTAGFVLAAVAQGAAANGIYTSGIGTRAQGMGSAFTAVADDSTAVFWNPAGLAQMEGRGINIGLYSMTAWMKHDDNIGAHNVDTTMSMFEPEHGDVFAKIYPTEPDHYDRDSVRWPSAATTPEVTGYWNFGRYTAGFGVFALGGAYSDYTGEGVDTMTNAVSKGTVHSLLGLVDVNASIGMRVTDQLYLGMGMDVLLGYLNGEVTKYYNGSTSALQPDYRFGTKSDSFGYGVQGVFGLLYKIHPRVNIAAVYKTGARMKLEGNTSASMTGTPFDFEVQSSHYIPFRFPKSLTLGVAWRPNDKLLLSADVQRIDWSDFVWPGGSVYYEAPVGPLQSGSKDPDWKASSTYRVGFEYMQNEKLTWRAGYMKDSSRSFPEAAEKITYTLAGGTAILNGGFSYAWKVWTGDFLVGAMWDGISNEDMKHRCAQLGVNFRRSF